MALHYRRLIAVAVLSALAFGVAGLPNSNGADKQQGGRYSISESMMYGEPVAFTEDGEFLEYVSDKRQKKDEAIGRPPEFGLPPHRRARPRPQTTTKKATTAAAAAAARPRRATCGPVTLPLCQGHVLYPLSQYPDVVGHRSEKDAASSLLPYLPLMNDVTCGEHLRTFLCLLLAPQCIGTEDPLAPCRSVCLSARDSCLAEMTRIGLAWPEDWSCDRFPNDGLCSDLDSQVSPVPEPITKSKQRHHSKKPFSNHVQRGSAAHQSRSSLQKAKHGGSLTSSIRARRYDIGQVGQPGLFQGWADVQGQGAANDYCRIIGSNPKLRFLSCTLAGSTGSNHHYVSKRGFDVGHPDTWFMRDMDGDGRDDYCRCVGRGIKSTISCMKAGEHGFYGSPQQPGDEHTFIIPSAGPCLQRKVNPFLGI